MRSNQYSLIDSSDSQLDLEAILWLSHTAFLLRLLIDTIGLISPQKRWCLTRVMDKPNQTPLP